MATISFKSKYITADEFKGYFGMDLGLALKDDDNKSNKSNAFLKRIEDNVERYLNANYNQNVELLYPAFTDFQKQHYKNALLQQAYYELRNSNISSDSGYDLDKGVVTDKAVLHNLTLGNATIDELRISGLLNTNTDKSNSLLKWGQFINGGNF